MQESIESTRTDLEERLGFETLLDDLVAMKKAAGRPKDMEDLNAPIRLKRGSYAQERAFLSARLLRQGP